MFKQTAPYKQITGNQSVANHLKRAVFYGRVSTPEQDKDKGSDKKTSREVQTESPYPWLAYKKLSPLRDEDIFFDTATGTNTERPELEKLMQEVRQGLVSIVLVWKIDRFGRNVRDFLNLFHELEQHGVHFCSLTEGIDTSAGEMGRVFAKVMMTMLAAFGEWENQTRKDRLYGGRMKKVERDGNWIGGTPPFGFTLVAHKLVKVTNDAEIVVFIYDAYLEFKSIARVVLEAEKEFARRNIGFLEFQAGEFKDPMTPNALIEAMKTKGGIDVPSASTQIESLNKLLELQEFYKVMKKRPNKVRDLISRLEKGQQLSPLKIKRLNRVLIEANYPLETPKSNSPIQLDRRQIGRMLKNQLYTGQMYSKKHRKILSEKKHDAIIDIETFNRVQMLLKTNYQGHKLAWSVRSPGFLFRDRTVCGHCGYAMVATRAPVNLKYYSCTLRRKEGINACVHKKCHSRDRFDQNNLATVIEHLKLIISQPGYLEEKMSLISLKEMEVLKKRIKDRRIHLSKIEEYKERWRLAFEERQIEGTEMTARIKGFEDDSLRIEHEILELEAQTEDVLRKRMDVNKVKLFAREFEKNFECANEEQRRDMINDVVKQVRVFNDTHTEFNFYF